MTSIVKQITKSGETTEVARFDEEEDAISHIEDLLKSYDLSGYCGEDGRWWARNGRDIADNLTFVIVGPE